MKQNNNQLSMSIVEKIMELQQVEDALGRTPNMVAREVEVLLDARFVENMEHDKFEEKLDKVLATVLHRKFNQLGDLNAEIVAAMNMQGELFRKNFNAGVTIDDQDSNLLAIGHFVLSGKTVTYQVQYLNDIKERLFVIKAARLITNTEDDEQ